MLFGTRYCDQQEHVTAMLQAVLEQGGTTIAVTHDRGDRGWCLFIRMPSKPGVFVGEEVWWDYLDMRFDEISVPEAPAPK